MDHLLVKVLEMLLVEEHLVISLPIQMIMESLVQLLLEEIVKGKSPQISNMSHVLSLYPDLYSLANDFLIFLVREKLQQQH